MEKTKISVRWKPRAEKALQNIYNYIAKDSSNIADDYVEKLIDFGDSLGFLPSKYPVCRHPSFEKRKLHCAAFDRNYIFIHAINTNEVVIFNIIHAKRIR